jgi:hypothetical protein
MLAGLVLGDAPMGDQSSGLAQTNVDTALVGHE